MRKKQQMEITTLGAARVVQAVLLQAIRDLERPVRKSREEVIWHRKNAIETIKWLGLRGSTFTYFCEAFGYDHVQVSKKVLVLAERKLRKVDNVKAILRERRERLHAEQAERDRERARVLSQVGPRRLPVRDAKRSQPRTIRLDSGEGQRGDIHTGQTAEKETAITTQDGTGGIQKD